METCKTHCQECEELFEAEIDPSDGSYPAYCPDCWDNAEEEEGEEE